MDRLRCTIVVFLFLALHGASVCAQTPYGRPSPSGVNTRPRLHTNPTPICPPCPPIAGPCGISPLPRLGIYVGGGVRFTYPVEVTFGGDTVPVGPGVTGAIPFGPNVGGPANYPAFPKLEEANTPPDFSGLWEYSDGGMITADYGCIPWDVNRGGLGHRGTAVLCNQDTGLFHVPNPAVQANAPTMSKTSEITFTQILGGAGFAPNAGGWPAMASGGSGNAGSGTSFRNGAWAPFIEIGYRTCNWMNIFFEFSWFSLSNEKRYSSSGSGDLVIRGFNDTFAFESQANIPWPASFTSSDPLDSNTYLFPLGRVAFPGSPALPPVQRSFFQAQVPNVAATQFSYKRLDFTVHEFRVGGGSWYPISPISRWGVLGGAVIAQVPYTIFRHQTIVSNEDVSVGAIRVIDAGDVIQDFVQERSGRTGLFGMFGGLGLDLAIGRSFLNATVGYDLFFNRISSNDVADFSIKLSGFTSTLGLGAVF